MSRYRRWNELLELLAAAGQLQVEDAAEALGVSAATIRRDFDELASQQMLTRIRGGAVAQGVKYDLPLRYKKERHPSEKQRIGELAASMVQAGQIAGLNGGTTTTEVSLPPVVPVDATGAPGGTASSPDMAAAAKLARRASVSSVMPPGEQRRGTGGQHR